MCPTAETPVTLWGSRKAAPNTFCIQKFNLTNHCQAKHRHKQVPSSPEMGFTLHMGPLMCAMDAPCSLWFPSHQGDAAPAPFASVFPHPSLFYSFSKGRARLHSAPTTPGGRNKPKFHWRNPEFLSLNLSQRFLYPSLPSFYGPRAEAAWKQRQNPCSGLPRAHIVLREALGWAPSCTSLALEAGGGLPKPGIDPVPHGEPGGSSPVGIREHQPLDGEEQGNAADGTVSC